jgi:GntR family transcriptional regulator / MocR family aminotransferase
MPKRPGGVPVTLPIAAHSELTLQRQVYEGLRSAILEGRLRSGRRLPSTRTLARDLRVSRNTVAAAFDQLVAEGFVEARVGSGTRVTSALSGRVSPGIGPLTASRVVRNRPSISRRGRFLSKRRAGSRVTTSRPFRPGWPALDHFPLDVWSRLASRVARQLGRDLLGYSSPAGYVPLRKAIAEYLGVARGVRCSEEQVIVTSGSQQALYIAAQALMDPDDEVWVEDPGYLGTRGALEAAGARLIPIPVDEAGIDVRFAERRHQPPRLVVVTPSHQFPLGVTMSAARRVELLRAARRLRAWIIEDDYDSEFRYSSRPIAALQGMDDDGRVVYVGTFSKTLFPGLRLGYAVVPPALVSTFAAARSVLDVHSPTLDQAVLAEFIRTGHFARHLRHMLALYSERHRVFVEESKHHLRGSVEVAVSDAGLQCVGWLAPDLGESAVARAATRHDVDVTPLSRFALRRARRAGVLLSFGAFEPQQIRAGVRRLADAIDEVRAEERRGARP